MMKKTRFTHILFTALLVAGGARDAHAQTAPVTSMRADSLRAGDILRLWIWREPDMSGDFAVPENGTVVFPRIGPRKVVGRRPVELRAELISEFQKYLRTPSIEVTFLHRVNVLGNVEHPGVFPLDETMTIANALSLAGGPTKDGKPDEVEIFRDGKKIVGRVTQETRIGDLPIRSGDQLYVPERSWASRNTSVLAGAFTGLLSVAIAILVRK